MEFAAKEKGAFIVIYFAGHGYEINGIGFVLTSDFPGPVNLSRIISQGIPIISIVEVIVACAGPKLIILDACRSDAAEHSDAFEIERFVNSAKDLKRMYSAAANASDLIFAFSTSAGEDAGDGVDGNSRYCLAGIVKLTLGFW